MQGYLFSWIASIAGNNGLTDISNKSVLSYLQGIEEILEQVAPAWHYCCYKVK